MTGPVPGAPDVLIPRALIPAVAGVRSGPLHPALATISTPTPAGAATTRPLAEKGHSVRVITRSGRAPEPGIEHLALDTTDAERLTDAVRDAVAVYQCAAPPYHR